MSTRVMGRVEENIHQLQRYQCFEIQMARLLAGWLPGIAQWEAKHQIGIHIWEDAEHSRELRTRLWELRVPSPDRGIVEKVLPVINALSLAQHDWELLAGVYLVLKANLLASYRTYLDNTYAVYDRPSVARMQRIIAEEEAQIAWARQTVDALVDTEDKRRSLTLWMRYAGAVITAAGGVDRTGEMGADAELPQPPPGFTTLLPFPQAKRDERFEVRLEAIGLPETGNHPAERLWQFINYTQEMQAAETLGSVLWEVEGMPWEFYYDVTRHCADEVRHCKLGETRLAQLGYKATDFPQMVGNYAWRQQIDPLRRYCVLTYIIEANGFDLKHEMHRKHVDHDDTESAQAVLFDILDETMHVRFGHKWVPQLMTHFGYDKPEDALVEECRVLNVTHTYEPAQRERSAQMKSTAHDPHN